MSTSPESIRVLHVDNEGGFANQAAEVVERQDERLAVQTAPNAAEGLECLSEAAFDCVISGYEMPGRNGLEFLEAVREDYPDLPFILYTGKGSEEVAGEAVSAGVTDYLRKDTGSDQYELLTNRITNAVSAYHARRELDRSRDLLEHVEQLAHTGGWEAEIETGEVRWTDGTYAIHDLDPDGGFDPSVEPAVEFYHPADRDEIERLVERCAETGEPYDVERRLRTADDRLRWVRTTGEPVREAGEIVALRGAIQDITERKTRERELERHDAFLARSRDVMTVVDADGTVRFQSASTAETTGFDPGQLIGQEGLQDVHPEDREEVTSRITSLLAEDESEATVELRVEAADGAWRWVEARGVNKLEDPLVQGVLLSTRDITDRKEREEELRQRNEEYEAVFETAQDAIFLWNVEAMGSGYEFRLQRLNPAHEAISGLSTDEDRGKTPRELLGEEAGREVAANYRRCVEAREPITYGEELELPSGTFHWRTKLGPVIRDGDVTQVVGVARDVTDQIERERTLTRLVEELGELIDTTAEEGACRVASEIAGDVLDAPLVGIHLVSKDGERLEAVAARDAVHDEFGIPPSYARDPNSVVDELVWEVFDTGESLHVADTRDDGTLAEETPARSGMIHPLGHHGVFISSDTVPAAFDETDRAFVELLSQALTAVLDRVEREDQLRKQKGQLERLHEVGQGIIQADSREEIAEGVVSGAESILNYPMTMVRYYDPAEGGLVPAAATAGVSDLFDSRRTFTPEGRSLNWSVYESGSPAVYDDISDIERAVDSGTRLQSLLVLPLEDHGTVSVGSTAEGAFDGDDVSFMRLLSATAELALSNLDREQELIEQRDELRRQNERLDEFADVVSHDLRNPLNVVAGRLELAAGDAEGDHLDAASRAVDRMETLIDDMLSLARVGAVVGETELVELSDLVDACWRNVETESAGLVAETDVAVRADETRLRQLFENLFRNAVEHGGADVTVTVGELSDGFSVEDDGPGIPEAVRAEVIEPGYSTSAEGTGFGLSIVRDIAAAHGWEVELTPADAGGARFEFTGVQQG